MIGSLPPGLTSPKITSAGAGSAFLAQVPALENGGHFFRDVVDRKRTAIDQQDNHRLARFHDCFHQIVLCAEQVERIAVAAMRFGPRFAVGALVFADHQNRHIRFPRRLRPPP